MSKLTVELYHDLNGIEDKFLNVAHNQILRLEGGMK